MVLHFKQYFNGNYISNNSKNNISVVRDEHFSGELCTSNVMTKFRQSLEKDDVRVDVGRVDIEKR